MRCRKCEKKAVHNMPQHRLALCREHYLEWIPEQTERFINKYRMFSHQDHILVAVSGGKDSLSLWDVLHRLEYKTEGIYINLGIDNGIDYSARSKQFAQEFADSRNLKLKIISLDTSYGTTIPTLAEKNTRGKDRPCSTCGLVKRYLMNLSAQEGDFDVLVTGHNLDDEAATLFGNTLTWESESIRRQSAVLVENVGLARKAKPFCRLYERDIAAYALLAGIDYIYDECPFAVGSTSIAHKEFLNQMESQHPGTKLIFYTSFLKAKDEGLFQDPEKAHNNILHPCPNCGQLTSATAECSFCRLMLKHS